ncbi:YSIRK signal domain/LPXTG anchor domain surface protein, partial [Lactobacillus mulieris]|nr:YSIRK signal domain/LPXTG anchor domain surface protein [Lactobacillus mulieris]
EVLNKYFYFDKQGNACLKKGITTQDININLDYASLSPIKIEYVDVDNGHILASIVLDSFWMTPESLQHRAGDKKAPDASRYEAAAINIPGYKLVSE